MGRLPDDRLDQLVTGHLREALEGQRGRAGAAFRARLAAERARPGVIAAPWKRRWWMVAGTLAAAACAMLIAYPLMRGGTVAGTGGHGSAPAAAATSPGDGANVLEDLTLTRDVDGGTIVMEDQTPARVLRRQELRHTQWFDAKEKAVMSVTQPVETVKYVTLQPY